MKHVEQFIAVYSVSDTDMSIRYSLGISVMIDDSYEARCNHYNIISAISSSHNNNNELCKSTGGFIDAMQIVLHCLTRISK